MAFEELLEAEAGVGRIQQVGGKARVEDGSASVDAQAPKRLDQRLPIMEGDAGPPDAQKTSKRPGNLRSLEEVPFEPYDGTVTGRQGQTVLQRTPTRAPFAAMQGDRGRRQSGEGQASRRRVGRPLYDDLDISPTTPSADTLGSTGSIRGEVSVEQFTQADPGGAQFQKVEEADGPVNVSRAPLEVVGRQPEGHVTHQHHQFDVEAHPLLVLLEVLA